MDITLGHEMGNDFFIMFRRLSDELWQRLLAVLNYGVAGKNPEFVLSCFYNNSLNFSIDLCVHNVKYRSAKDLKRSVVFAVFLRFCFSREIADRPMQRHRSRQ